ncbi:BON domain-containing protein [Ancylobacter lacus]|uniref:BON domain-containing protein n=1 Tax=Ancylobacter lacus TaxID=2579970 RepID=UPI001BCB2F24|nr:BON domain-containing protein [Ancylobacter lacus]MBS7541355.1 BON domain-containing protein [Ancylobacter lacus]
MQTDTLRNLQEELVRLGADGARVALNGDLLTLTGSVASRRVAVAAEEAARRAAGMRCVINLLTVSPCATAEAIRRRIGEALRASADQSAEGLRIELRGNHVTLEGKVHTAQERYAVRHAAVTTPGVSGVVDRLSIAD